jgi:hypothetical protein
MNQDDVIIKLEWNDFFKKLQDYGNTFINENRASILSQFAGDSHTIIHRSVSDFPAWLIEGFPIKVLVLQIFAILPESVGMTHKDGLERKSAFNIPLNGAELGHMDWFNLDIKERKIDTKYTQIRLTENEKNHNSYRITDVPTYSVIIDKPSLVNTDVWHRIDNRDNKNFRYTISIRFKGNPSFSELKEKFSL